MVRNPRRTSARVTARLGVERLEDRCLLATTSLPVIQTNLVSDLPGVAQQLDPNLVNPWGISESPSTATRPGSPFWISDNNAGVSTLYNTAGVPQSLIVSIPAPGDPLGASGTPTGTVFNGSGGFAVSGVASDGTTPATGSAVFLFATEDGTIVGWNRNVNPTGLDPTKAGTYGIIAVDNSANPSAANGAVYKGLAIATDSNSRTLLYAANFRSGKIDVFDTSFHSATGLAANAFTDPKLPKGYAPFDVQTIGSKIYVTYALQNSEKHDDVAGPGHGFVDVFNLDGSAGLDKGNMRLISRSPLNSPWGLAIAPSTFGNLSGSLLVGNFGDGRINAFDPTTGKFLGKLTDPDGEPIQINGLWGLKVGNGGNGGDANTVYFTAGIFDESHGLFGSLAPPPVGMSAADVAKADDIAEAQMLRGDVDVVALKLAAVQQDIANGVTGTALRQDLHDFHRALVQLTQDEARAAADVMREHRNDVSGHAVEHGLALNAVTSIFAGLDGLMHHGR
jgi:uncharacterized protein (TIGR03118 family)